MQGSESTQNRKFSQRQFSLVAAVVVAVLVGAIAVRHHRAQAAAAARPQGRPALTVQTTTLQADRWDRTLLATGSILPWQEASIGAQVQGLRIATVRVSLGDHVKRGQVLATLDNGVGPAGRSHVQGRIVAPDSGVISAAEATVGTMPRPGVELFRLIRQDRLEWHAELTADELMLLHRGMRARIALGEGRVIEGRVRAISPEVDPRTRYGLALVSLQSSRGIVAGAFARGTFDISGGKQPVETLPDTAVLQRGSKTFVLVVGADDHVHERAVLAGQRKGGRVQIISGLKPGEKVVDSGGAFLTDGDVVQIVK